jgi:beta-aspartyl-peptidase (threonine type)|tara:strand:+ start:810 stop:1778 length:969 start_codon:yes stop_codon:yes gene_type:complete
MADSNASADIAMVIHGGAGSIVKSNMDRATEQAYREKLAESIRRGYAILESGGNSIDAVVAAITVMEDSPLFNAGKGAVFSHDGRNELDASIMEGRQRNAGAIASVTRVKNPIQLAARVMTASPHVLLVGDGAEVFAAEQGIPLVDSDYFHTERRWNQLQELLRRKGADNRLSEDTHDDFELHDHHFGTVGAVALDRCGDIAAGTSTGGMTNKQYGRVGDSPVVGAGTYADNRSCGISATGHGEYFLRAVVAHDICSRVAYKGISLRQATDEVIGEELVQMNGEGGAIGLDPAGNPVMSFNTSGMYRAAIDTKGNLSIAIFK